MEVEVVSVSVAVACRRWSFDSFVYQASEELALDCKVGGFGEGFEAIGVRSEIHKYWVKVLMVDKASVE